MTTFWKAYPSEAAAREAVETLLTAGVPGRDLRLLTGSRTHDVRTEPVGEFGRTASPNAPVGTYANVHRLRRQGAGIFAGDPDRKRQGSFADADRDTILSYDAGGEHAHISGAAAVRRLLREAALDEAAADRIMRELHDGHAVVIAADPRLGEILPAA
jgi:hypothetical protein